MLTDLNWLQIQLNTAIIPVILNPAHHRLLSLYFMLCKCTGVNSVIIPKPLTSSLAPIYFSAASTTKDLGSTLSESWFHEGLFHKRSRANFTHCIKACLSINICLIWQCLTLASLLFLQPDSKEAAFYLSRQPVGVIRGDIQCRCMLCG